ncbi:transport and Golgi organization protein 1 isoform X1 [Ceratina calcarata]|uniref:Transport and Golgi organization protein 1 isoform X1 n=1 Tax=Ceratina calcarata TaxID=156304 RepID=A0AAJ7N4F8_9HYME|nr:transport and Golgi organization protein 1 isoform X1 [Ceratina calcarata]
MLVMWNYDSRNMTRTNLLINVLFLFIAIIINEIPECFSALSDKRLCYDPNCSEPVSLARTSIKYMPNEPGLLPFDVNVIVKVYSKEAGNRTDLWGVEINGKHGYVPKEFLKEYKILHKKLLYEVSTDSLPSKKLSSGGVKEIHASREQNDNLDLKPTEKLPQTKVDATPPYEVIDGTTVHLDHKEPPVQPAFVKEVIQATVVPNGNAINDSAINATESNIFRDNIEVSEESVKTEEETVKTKEETVKKEEEALKVNVTDFVTTSEEILDTTVLSSDTKSDKETSDSILSQIKEENIQIKVNVTSTLSSDTKDDTADSDKGKVVDFTTSNIPDAELIVPSTKNVENDTNASEKIETATELDTTEAKENVTINAQAEHLESITKLESEQSERDVPKISGIASSLNISAILDNVEYDVKIEENKKVEVIDTSIPQTITADDGKETVNAENKTQLDEKGIISGKEIDVKSDVQTVKTTDEIKIDDKTVSIETTDKETSDSTLSQIKEEDTQITVDVKEDTADSDKVEVVDFTILKIPDAELIVPSTKNVENDTNASEKIETATELDTTEAKENVTINAQAEHLESITKLESEQSERDVPKISGIASSLNISAILDNVEYDVKIEENKKVEVIDTSIPQTITADDGKETVNAENKTQLDEKGIISGKEIDVKSDVQTVKTTDEIKIDDKTVSIETTDKETSDSTLSQIKEEDTQITVDVKEDTADSDKVEVVDFTILKIPDAELIVPNTKNLENDTNASEKIETATELDTTEAKENVTINAQVEHLESITKLESEQIESAEIEKSKEEDLKKYGDAISPLFLESNIINEPITSSEDIRARLDTDTQSDLQVLDKQNASEISDIEDIKEETPIPYESSIESILSVKEKDFSDVCTAEDVKCSMEDIQSDFTHQELVTEDNALMAGIQIESNYWMMLMYLTITAVATLMFSLGYYCIENMRRDRQLIARVNKLEKDLLISEAECAMSNENLKSTKEKLSRMEDESFGSDEMVLSLRAELEASQNVKMELEDQVAMLEKDLESATEAGLELERMLREVLSTNDDVNPLAQSVEDLQARLNAQQAANESLTNALNLKTQENDSLKAELVSARKNYEELEIEFTRLREDLKLETNLKNSIERTLTEKMQRLEMQIKEISTEKAVLQKELKTKKAEATDLAEVINRLNSNNLDLNKLYDVSHVKAEATALLEERNELKVRLAEIEGAHNLLEEHVKMVKEEMAILSEQYKLAEKEKKDAETRLEVLTNFFEEKEAQRQKEEAIWLQQQGEVVSTVERIQIMQTEIQNYKQQIEMLKREIMDQEREYKSQISLLETKAHEQWVVARQVERRLEESKVEAGQLRNRLTLIEKNINDVDSEAKLHRLEANGETTTSPPLFIGAESSNSSMMFSGSSNVPPPPPSYLHSLFPPYLPPPLPNSSGVPPYDVSQRPPPLGGRLSSPPPMPLHPPSISNRYDRAGSPPPMSPHLLPPFNHRSPPPSFGNDIPPPPPGSILPPPPLGAPHSWSEDSLPPPRNPGFHPAQQRVRNHKGSLHSSRESLDKLHHNSKV